MRSLLNVNLKIFILEKQFVLLNEKVKKILNQIKDEGIGLIRPNNNIKKLFTAVRDQNESDLDSLLSEIEKESSINFNNQSSSDKIVFKKEQALIAAKWWLKTLDKIPEIQAHIKKEPDFQKLDLSEAQKRIFVATLADLIWDHCQLPSLSYEGMPPIYVGFNSLFVKRALYEANITSLDTECKLSFFAFVCHDGKVTYQDGRETGLISEPKCALPSDQLIVFRDIMSTITAGHNEEIGIRHLPDEVIIKILSYLNPKELDEGQFDKEIVNNCKRIHLLYKHYGINKQSFDISKTAKKPGRS